MKPSPRAPVPSAATRLPASAGSTLVWTVLGSKDLGAIDALHRRSIRGLGPEVVKAETVDFFRGLLGGRGEILGLTAGGELVAYGVLQHDLLPEDDPRAHLGLAPEVPVRKLAGAAVDPRWRGQRLQRALVEERIKRAGPQAAIFATSAPGNPASWRTLMACGLTVCALESRYGGHARFLMARLPQSLPDPAARAATEPAQDVRCDDLPTQAALLSAGWHGVAPGPQGPNGPTIRYRRVAVAHPPDGHAPDPVALACPRAGEVHR